MFPMDPMNFIGRPSNPPVKVLFTFPVLSYDYTSGNSSALDCTSGFIFPPLDSRFCRNLVESIGHVLMCMNII